MKRFAMLVLFCISVLTLSVSLALEKPYIEVNASDEYTVHMAVADNGQYFETDMIAVPESAMSSIVWQGGGEDAIGYLVSMRDVSTDQQVGEARRPYDLWNTEINPFDFGIGLDVPYKIGVASYNENEEEQWTTMYFIVVSEQKENQDDNAWPEAPTEEADNEPEFSEWAEEEDVEPMPEAVEFYEPMPNEITETNVAFSWSWPDYAEKFKFGLRDLDTNEKIADDVELDETYYECTNLTPGHQYRAAVASVSESGIVSSWRELYFTVRREAEPTYEGVPDEPGEIAENEPDFSGWPEEINNEPENSENQEENIEPMPEAVEFYEPMPNEITETNVAFSWSWPDYAEKFKFGLRDLDTNEKIADDVELDETYYECTNLTPGHQYRAAVASVAKDNVAASWREVEFVVRTEQNAQIPNQTERETEQVEETPSQPTENPIQPTEIPVQPTQAAEPTEEKSIEKADQVQIEGLTEGSLVGTDLTVQWNWPGNAESFIFAMKDLTSEEKIVPDQRIYESVFQCPALTPGHSYQIAVASIPYGWDGQAQTASWRVLKVNAEDEHVLQEDAGMPSVEVSAAKNRILEGSGRAFSLLVNCRNTRTITVEIDDSKVLESWAKEQNQNYQKAWMFTQADFNDYNYAEMKRTMEFYPETDISAGKHTVTVIAQNGNGQAQATAEIEIVSKEQTLEIDIDCPDIEFRSDEVKRESIRFVAQVEKYNGKNSNAVFKESQWRYVDENGMEYGKEPGNKCSYASLSMALSYLGVDCLPGRMFCLLKNKDFNQNKIIDELKKEIPSLSIYGDAGIGDNTLSMEKLNGLIEKYAQDFNYSPVITWIQYTKRNGSQGQHMMVLVGKQGDTYYFVNPAASSGLSHFQIELVSTAERNEELRIRNASHNEYNNGYISRIFQIRRE